jgi:hypothetical protein
VSFPDGLVHPFAGKDAIVALGLMGFDYGWLHALIPWLVRAGTAVVPAEKHFILLGYDDRLVGHGVIRSAVSILGLLTGALIFARRTKAQIS